ncbi:hypothetical protein EDD18DRAFT_1166510 [Armillaria luteobubalina]|uniref:Uncharacterized protein n=1 Tax=Armillaria luteobubalina TaxID=153913 RepID=A0AA39Q7Q1_9AGAR|nr:hypothetical protein EDD18DRAFT_1166510 [Armillaria luteobubalina]
MSSIAAPSIFGSAPAPRRGSDSFDSSPTGASPLDQEALKLRLDLNLEVEISIKAKVNGDITLSLL